LLRHIETPELNSPRTDFTHFHFQYSYLSNTSKKTASLSAFVLVSWLLCK